MTASIGLEVPPVVNEVNHWLKHGKPEVGWRGDPALSLEIGVVKATRGGYDSRVGKVVRAGDVIAWQWQVWRHTERGKDEIILQLKGHELYTVFDRLITIDPRTPGFEPTMDRVEREGAQVEKAKEQAIREAHAEHAEHLWALVAERQNGRSTIRGVPGLNPDKQL